MNYRAFLFFSLVLLVISCGPKDPEYTAHLAFVNWSRSRAATYLYAAILERKGFLPVLHDVPNSQMWSGTASGEYDGMFSAWLPHTHERYYQKFQDSVELLHPNFSGTKLGFVVPDYVYAENLEDLVRYGERFDYTIIGIDPGAGMSLTIQRAIEEDLGGLGSFNYQASSEPVMLGLLERAMDQGDWIVVPGWIPHRTFSQRGLKFLQDEENLWGDQENIYTVVSHSLQSQKPELYRYLRDTDWQMLEGLVTELMLKVLDNPDSLPEEARQIVSQNWTEISPRLPR
jgi:glycine betaine/proline transport system substrate-binding protein